MIHVCLILFSLWNVILTLTIKDNEIFDLEETTEDAFLLEAGEWQLTNTRTSTTTSSCPGTIMLAGLRILQQSGSIQRTYTINQPHKSVFISFEASLISDWATTDKASIIVRNADQAFSNQKLIDAPNSVQFSASGYCTPSSVKYSKRRSFLSSAHEGSNLTLLIESSTPSSSTASFGIRDLVILISNATISPPTQCLAGSTASQLNNNCGCGSCTTCGSSCATCIGTASNVCYSCPDPGYFYDGTECKECYSDCVTCSGSGKYKCQTCPTGHYLYPTFNCESTCIAPYISETVKGVKYCKAPCSQTGGFYYNDGECRDECVAPFSERTDEYGGKFCDYPCGANEYLYPDPANKCRLTECPSHFEMKKYYESPSYQYCLCVSPYMLASNGHCIPIPKKNNADELASLGNTAGVISSVGLTIAGVALPGDPGGVSAGALTKILQYSKFLRIKYPVKLILMFKAYNPASGIMSFIPKMSDSMKGKFENEKIPETFAFYEVHSCFIVNFWSFMLFLVILLVVFVCLKFFEMLAISGRTWIRKIRVVLQNFWITQFYNCAGDIFLFSMIQFRDNYWTSAESALSFIVAIVFFCSVFVVIFIHFRTLMKYQKAKKRLLEEI